jgi:hypothetical protein
MRIIVIIFVVLQPSDEPVGPDGMVFGVGAVYELTGLRRLVDTPLDGVPLNEFGVPVIALSIYKILILNYLDNIYNVKHS